MAKVDWKKIRKDYLLHEDLSYGKLAEKYGISVRAVEIRGSQDGWLKLREEIAVKVRQKLPEKVSETLAEVKKRHIETAQLLQQEGLDAITQLGIHPTNFRDAIQAIVAGVNLERKAQQMDRPDTLVQQNNFTYESPDWFTPPTDIIHSETEDKNK